MSCPSNQKKIQPWSELPLLLLSQLLQGHDAKSPSRLPITTAMHPCPMPLPQHGKHMKMHPCFSVHNRIYVY
jgi:hypothetical protein